ESKRRAVTGAYYYRANGTTPFKATNFFVELNETPILAEAPYTPVIRLLHLSYTAEAQQADCHLFWLHPFGGFEPWPSAEPLPLLPQFAQEGELLIGVVNLDPPTALPLLFQVAEATADTELRRTEASEPTWSYLRGNTWKSLSDRISEDATQGLIRSGIVHLGIPEDISNAGTTILDPSLHWIKLSVPARSRTVCHIIGLHPQAARATFADGGNDPDRLAEPLPAGTIAKLEKPQPAVKGIEQPYPSEGGRVQEAPPQFYTRVSERLRHKGRAVTIFDYERLVLENFPDIYKVRCLNHGQFDDQTNALFELAPGAVTLAVLPDLSQRPTLNDLQPKVNINRLQAIEDYLTTLASSWSTIKVVNPQYEPIQVTFEVKFRSPYDANFGFYRRELDRAIASFLTPWTLDQAADINFGGRIYRSSILNFVEEQDYVDYVTNFRMTHLGQDVREAIASTARSVLTSVPPGPAQGHGIAAVQATQAIANLPVAAGGLGYEPLDELELDP
ncbi:MAG: baseplate J/gp47 family protein, partial [Cyanobacteria bacterium P01_A01_bin.135]